jgi:hypothetical protein
MSASGSLRPARDIAAFGIVIALGGWVCVLATEYYLGIRSVQRHHLETAWMWFAAAAIVAAVTSRREPGEVARERDISLPRAWPIALVAIALVLYLPALRLGFLSDDFTLLDLAARDQFFGLSWSFLRPLPLLVYRMVGAHPAALHALIVILHGVNAALVVRLAGVFGLASRQAAAAGLLFLTFPADLEAVAWCAGVQDVLMTAGVLGAVVAASVSTAALSLAAVAASLFSKETAVAAPFLIWLSNRARWRTAAAALGIVAVYSVWRVATRPLAEGYAATPSSYTLKELLVRPFATLSVPFRSEQIGEWRWLGIVLVCGLVVLLGRAAWLWRGNLRRLVLAGLLALWVFVSIAPVYSMCDFSGTLQGSRYVYLATAGWSILLAAMLMPRRSRIDLALAAGVCVIGIAGVRLNLAPWARAALIRNEVLAAVDHARAAGCASVWIRDVPDSVQGAYVFRNGLAEAIAPVTVGRSAPPACWVSVPFPASY